MWTTLFVRTGMCEFHYLFVFAFRCIRKHNCSVKFAKWWKKKLISILITEMKWKRHLINELIKVARGMQDNLWIAVSQKIFREKVMSANKLNECDKNRITQCRIQSYNFFVSKQNLLVKNLKQGWQDFFACWSVFNRLRATIFILFIYLFLFYLYFII